MKKRIVSLLLCIIMVLGSFPMEAIGTDIDPATDFAVEESTQTPEGNEAEEPSEKNTEIFLMETKEALNAGTEVGTSTTPENYLTFSSEEPFTLKTANTSKNWNGTLYYSTDLSEWMEWNGEEISSSLSGKLYLAGEGNAYITGSFNLSNSNYSSYRFVLSGNKISCNGNIMSLLDYNSPNTAIMSSAAFAYLFYENANLISAPELPTATLKYDCYSHMFYGCTSLIVAPVLPAETLTDNCYEYMFYGCSSLTDAPELPAKTLTNYCYKYMFSRCVSLVDAPKLPATTLAVECYSGMFSGCISLTEVPTLPAITLSDACYFAMFSDCTFLTTAPELPATNLAVDCYLCMFQNCTMLTEVPELPAETLTNNCYEYMFRGCTGIKVSETKIGNYREEWSIPAEATEATDWNTNMFSGTGGTFTSDPEIGTTYYLCDYSHTHCVCGAQAVCEGHGEVTYEELTSWSQLAADGDYYLGDTIPAVNGNITISANVNLCLNGKTLDLGSYKITNSGTLTICDCQETTGKITNNSGYNGTVINEGIFNLYGGVISNIGSRSYGLINEGTVNIYEGHIVGNDGAGISNSHIANIYGGYVSGRTSGNGITNNMGAVLIVSGGEIYSGSYYGIHNSAGTVYIIKNPEFSGNGTDINHFSGNIYAAKDTEKYTGAEKISISLSSGTELAIGDVIVYNVDDSTDDLFELVNSNEYKLVRGIGENADNLVLEKLHEHVWSEAWSSNENAHWHACTAEGCDIVDYSAAEDSGCAYAAHSKPADDGDCTTAVECATCHYVFTAGNSTHSFTSKDSGQKASDSTCTENQKNYVQCDNCDVVSKTVTVEVANSAKDHRYIYTNVGAAIVEVCDNDCGHSANITVSAPEKATFGDNLNAETPVTIDGEFKGAYSISYAGREGTSYNSTVAPTNAGKYTAKITVGTAGAEVDYEIKKANPKNVTWPSELEANLPAKLKDVVLTGGFSWKEPENDVLFGKNAYVMIYTPTDTNNYNTLTKEVTVTGKDVTPPAISGIENGKTYHRVAEFTVDEERLVKVEVNGNPISPDENGKYILICGTEQKTLYTVKAIDTSSNETEIIVVVESEHTYTWGAWKDIGNGVFERLGICNCGDIITGTNVTLSGSIISFETGDITIEFYKEGNETPAYSKVLTAVEGTTDYALDKVEAGNYTLVITKPCHREFRQAVTVGKESIVINASLSLKGDVTGDNRITKEDGALIYSYCNGYAELSDEKLAAADIDGNGYVSVRDAMFVYDYCNKVTNDL